MYISVCILGVIALIAQTAFLREILATFSGGELTIGVALLFWLIWTSVGSILCGRLLSRNGDTANRFHELLPWYGFFGYLGVIIIGNVPLLARLIPGELVPYDLQFIMVSSVFLPFNILGGFLFVLGSKSITYRGSPSTGRTYTMEAFGSALAGLLISFMLVHVCANHTMAMVSPVIAILTSLGWHLRRGSRYGLVRLIIPLALFTAFFHADNVLTDYSYRGQTLLGEVDTRYGRLRVTGHEEQITFYSNASVLFSTPDPESVEHSVHLPMLAAENPRNVLVLGGGWGESISEVLKYPGIERVTCVELDPGLFTLAERYQEETWSLHPQVEKVVADGRAYLEQADKQQRFDVIIMSMPAPLSGVANRYYTQEFFTLAASHLHPGGILGFSLVGDENYLSDDLALFLASIRKTLAVVFPSIIQLPGVRCRFLAGTVPGILESLDWKLLTSRREERGIETNYVRDYFLSYTMSPFKMNLIKESLEAVEAPPVNSDIRPVGYFIRTILQGDLDGSLITARIKNVVTVRSLYGCMFLVLLLLVFGMLLPGKNALRRVVASTVMSLGLTEISLEVLAIMAYQSIFGFLYGRIALLTGSYMAGLALGGWVETRMVEKGRAGIRHLALIQSGMTLIPLIWAVLLGMHSLFPGQVPFLEQWFYVLTGIAGFAGGFQFPAADAFYRKSLARPDSGLGDIYGIDLAGSSVGALVTASLMVPNLGMLPVLIFLAVLNGITAVVLWLRL